MLQLRLEEFARCLTRKHAYENAQVFVQARLDRVVRVRAEALDFPSPTRRS